MLRERKLRGAVPALVLVLGFCGLMLVPTAAFGQYGPNAAYSTPYVPKDPMARPMTGTAQPSTGAVRAPAGYGSGTVPAPAVTPSVTPTSISPTYLPQPQGGSPRSMPVLNPYPKSQPTTYSTPVTYGRFNPSSVEKPFANYQPAPVVSPYMNLYRRDNFTGVDNYNFYVRPALQAQQEQQQVQARLNTLQKQQEDQQRAQYNASVRTSTVGASYGQINTGYTAPNPGASYGFSGLGAPIRPEAAPEAEPSADKKLDAEDESDADETGKKKIPVVNPYMNNQGFSFEYNP